MMLKHAIVSALFVPAFLATTAAAYDCTGITPHKEKSPYANGEEVLAQGSAYRCTESGWCSQGGPYAPGDGWAWREAWQKLGVCDKGTVSGTSETQRSRDSSGASEELSSTCSDVRSWHQAEAYSGGIRAQHNGYLYEAKWWTQGDAPGERSTGWQTWELVGSCDYQDGTA